MSVHGLRHLTRANGSIEAAARPEPTIPEPLSAKIGSPAMATLPGETEATPAWCDELAVNRHGHGAYAPAEAFAAAHGQQGLLDTMHAKIEMRARAERSYWGRGGSPPNCAAQNCSRHGTDATFSSAPIFFS
jgi:hypothetical protein